MTKLQKSLFILFNSLIIISFFAGILHFFWAIISGSEFVQLPYGFSIHLIMFLLFLGYCLVHSCLALQPQKKRIAIILFGGLTCLALVGMHHMLANVRVYHEAQSQLISEVDDRFVKENLLDAFPEETTSLYFTKEACPDCAPVTTRLKSYSKHNFVKILYYDTQKNANGAYHQMLMKQLKITSVPTLLLFKNKQVFRYEGYKIYQYIEKNAPQALEEN